MWRTRERKTASIRPRPIRIAYLVPLSPAHALLDVLFDECMSRWGGRRTPIVPTDGASISGELWSMLDLWDADVIYSYVDLTDELHDRLAHLLAPGQIIRHEREDADADRHNLFPDTATHVQFLSTFAVMPVFAKQATLRGQTLPEVLDKERWVNVPRDFEDSFGFASSSEVDISLLPYALRLSYRTGTDRNYAPRFSSPGEISYIDSLPDLEARLASGRRTFCIAQMSDMFAPYLRSIATRPHGWEDHLSIVVGDEVSDRLLYWNAIHRYEALTGPGNYQVLRLSPVRFANGVPDWIVKLCSGQNNYRHLDGNAAPRIALRSCSLSEEGLRPLAETLRQSRTTFVSAIHHPGPALFDPLKKSVRKERHGMSRMFPSTWNNSAEERETHVKFDRDEFELPLSVPAFLREAMLTGVTSGAWAVDLKIERDEDHSRYSNRRHEWTFPRRLRIDCAVEIGSYGIGQLSLPPRPRPAEGGQLILWDGLRWRRPTVRLPSDIDAFAAALVRHHPHTRRESLSHKQQGKAWRFSPIAVSDKGRDFLRVCQLFGSLPETLEFVTNPYILDIIRRLCPTEIDASSDRVKRLGNQLQTMIEAADPQQRDYGVLARNALSLAAEHLFSGKKQGAPLSYLELWNAVPSELKTNDNRRQLERSIKFLRNQRFLLQGFAWDCRRCQHPNWIHLQDIQPELSCEICRTEKSAPVCGDGNIHFRLNPFVAEAFSSVSSQGPVFWCLQELLSRTEFSLMFAPAFDIHLPGEKERYTDIDLLASVDGEVFLLEVKKSFSGIKHQHLEQLLEIARLVRPDVAGFAVPQAAATWTIDAAARDRIVKELGAIDVRFELITPSKQSRANDIPDDHYRKMDWSAW